MDRRAHAGWKVSFAKNNGEEKNQGGKSSNETRVHRQRWRGPEALRSTRSRVRYIKAISGSSIVSLRYQRAAMCIQPA